MTDTMDGKSFKDTFMPMQARLYGYAFSILHDSEDAADCVQEAFTRLWDSRRRLRGVDNPEAYALAAVRNTALSMARNRSGALRQESPLPETEDSAGDPARIAEGVDDLRRVRSLLLSLPEAQRRVIVMSAVAGLSNDEITTATGFSNDNVRALLSRGRRRLKQLFAKD